MFELLQKIPKISKAGQNDTFLVILLHFRVKLSSVWVTLSKTLGYATQNFDKTTQTEGKNTQI
jgi:hypothetical protein